MSHDGDGVHDLLYMVCKMVTLSYTYGVQIGLRCYTYPCIQHLITDEGFLVQNV